MAERPRAPETRVRDATAQQAVMKKDPAPAGDVTLLLQRWRSGDAGAMEALTPLVYDHLRMLAGAFVNGQPSQRQIQPTELVGELFVTLLAAERLEINDRNHFFAFAAKVMRQILVHNARRFATAKRGGHMRHVPLDAELAWTGTDDNPAPLDLDAALTALERLDEPSARAVELRFLFGFTAEETARTLGVSKATVDRTVRFGLTWLHCYLHPDE